MIQHLTKFNKGSITTSTVIAKKSVQINEQIFLFTIHCFHILRYFK